ncbi:alpha/beta fold hydrolase [Candidatus Saccharibacteria bacterium]|nr:alpha/beta fold hydrolase [Candidatus Saccharibacteria bacterium]
MRHISDTVAHEPLQHIEKEFITFQRHHNGVEYHFLATNTKAKRGVLLLHGVTGNKLDMVVLGRHLARQGYAVYAPDLPGHGSAKGLVAKDFDQLGRWLDGCVASLAAQGVSINLVIGNSFAAAICYNYAQQGLLPDGCQLLLNCPTPDISRASRLLRYMGQALPEVVAWRLYNSHLVISIRIKYLHVSKRPEAKRWLRESELYKRSFLDVPVSNAMSALLHTHNPYEGRRLTKAVQQRTEYIIGDRDNVVTRHTATRLRQLLPDATPHVIHGAGHILHFDAWKECAEIAAAQLAKAEKE